MIAFYPIKPIYIDRIFRGEKLFELRKSLPSCPIKFVLLYSTMPVGKVIGYAEVKALHKRPVTDLWRAVRDKAGISKAAYDEYFLGRKEACAIELVNIHEFTRPFGCDEISSDFVVPQSFCYIEEKIFNRIKRRKAVCI